MLSELPAFLTIEEAARVLRIGRTKAYALANEWRATNGKRGMRVLDLGCGAGALGPTLRAMGFSHLVGVEIAPEAAARARENYDDVLEMPIDEALPRITETFDLIVCADILEHLVDLTRFGQVLELDGGGRRELLVDDLVAEVDALVADVDAGPGAQLLDLAL